MITDDMMVGLQGIIPSLIATCNADGVPNIAIISQVYYVDPDHVALSHQFFNKTIRNLKEIPRAQVFVQNPVNGLHWKLQIEYARTETEGDLFDQMTMQLEAIASMMGMEDVFKLKAAEIFRVLSVQTEN